MVFTTKDITIASFLEIFKNNVEKKEKAGIVAIQKNPKNLLKRAQFYGTQFKNKSWGWTSNIWNRSAKGSVVINSETELLEPHRELMLRALEHMLCQPMIQVNANLGEPGSKAEMRCRLYCDPQFPDIAYRWAKLNFKGDSSQEPDATIFFIPHYLENPSIPGKSDMLRIIRFPHHKYTIVTCSSYQGEIKKGFLTHWIYYVYQKGGTGEHAALKEFTVKKKNGKKKKIVMGVWGLTGSGKSTHGLYIVDSNTAPLYKEKFGIDVSGFISGQAVKNDDIVGVFKDQVVSPESGSWTKTEDVNKSQIGIYKAAMSPHALHENTEWGDDGNVSFKGEVLQYYGKPNQNARTVLMLKDTGYFDGSVDSTAPLNMAIFISPGYNSDFAWIKIDDPDFSAKVLADGRTVGHPAQGRQGVGEVKYEARYCDPFTMGATNAEHVIRFHGFIKERENTDNPIDIYLVNTTGKIGAEYDWVEEEFGREKIKIPKTRFKEINGKIKPVGGTGPSIEETELFLFQAARGEVEYEPHSVWGGKVLVPKNIPGISKERLRELNPFSYNSLDEMKALLKAQIQVSKFFLSKQCPGLPDYILKAMDF
jgi:phosphoenolpyruvate carboxykinase (ATP)